MILIGSCLKSLILASKLEVWKMPLQTLDQLIGCMEFSKHSKTQYYQIEYLPTVTPKKYWRCTGGLEMDGEWDED